MKRLSKLVSLIFSFSLCAAAAIAQQPNPASNAPSASQRDSSAPDAAQGQASPDEGPLAEACWQQAGISKSVMRTRRSIMQNAKTQIQQIESDASLTPGQQNQEIRQIRQNARRQILKVITPEQERTLQQCQRQARNNRQAAGAATSPASPPNN